MTDLLPPVAVRAGKTVDEDQRRRPAGKALEVHADYFFPSSFFVSSSSPRFLSVSASFDFCTSST